MARAIMLVFAAQAMAFRAEGGLMASGYAFG
jgi:hypothetical protein